LFKHLRVLATSGIALSVAAMGVVATPTAQAATTQKICSSGSSVIHSVIYLKDATPKVNAELYRGDCAYVVRGANTLSYREAKSYRVGYNYGSYSSDCRTNNYFIPWTGADVIYFKFYSTASCVNP